jgi:hypothetical protein
VEVIVLQERHITRQLVAHVPQTRIVSLARRLTTANGAKILVHVKKEVNPETELAKFPLQIVAIHTAKSMEILAARLAII